SPRLASIRIAEGEVHTGNLLVLQQVSDHLVKGDVRPEGELADTVAVFVGVAVVPELLLEVGARAMHRDQASFGNLQRERRGREVAVLLPEVVARGAIADEHAVDARRGGEDLAGRQVRPVARADEPAGLDPGGRW